MSWLSITGVWCTVLAIVPGFTVFFVQRPRADQFYGGLLIVSVGCAIGLPQPQAAFWRTLVMALATGQVLADARLLAADLVALSGVVVDRILDGVNGFALLAPL